MDPRLWYLYLLHWFDMLGPRWRTISLVVLACALVLLLERFKRKRPDVPTTASYPSDRRREPRIPVDNLPVHITNADVTGEQREGVITNCSASGIGLRLDRETAPGTILSVRPIDAPGYSVWAQVEVKHCKQGEDGWTVGCRFVRTPPWVAPLLG